MFDQNQGVTIYLEDLKTGMQSSRTKEVSDDDILAFAKVTTDRNPVHLDDAFAATTIFGKRIVHGALTASLISAVIGEQLPGNGCIYLGQTLRFVAPVFPGDSVTALVEITEIDRKRSHVKLDCKCSVEGKTVLTGEAEVLVPRRRTKT